LLGKVTDGIAGGMPHPLHLTVIASIVVDVEKTEGRYKFL
jgi:hypothetical protein